MSQAFVNMVRAQHNHICLLYDSELVRVIGIHFDGMDAYYRVKGMGSYGNPPEVRMTSMVGGCESLKGILPRYDRTDELFALNGCPPTETFSVTADTRRQFGLLAGDQALRHYDEDIVPLLRANGGEPNEGGEDPAIEIRAAFNAAYPGYEDTIARLLWLGTHEGADRFIDMKRGGFTFNRTTGEVEGDIGPEDENDISAIMQALNA